MMIRPPKACKQNHSVGPVHVQTGTSRTNLSTEPSHAEHKEVNTATEYGAAERMIFFTQCGLDL